MKKMILSLCLIGLSLTAGAQENGVFVSVGVGTQTTSRAFRAFTLSLIWRITGTFNFFEQESTASRA